MRMRGEWQCPRASRLPTHAHSPVGVPAGLASRLRRRIAGVAQVESNAQGGGGKE